MDSNGDIIVSGILRSYCVRYLCSTCCESTSLFRRLFIGKQYLGEAFSFEVAFWRKALRLELLRSKTTGPRTGTWLDNRDSEQRKVFITCLIARGRNGTSSENRSRVKITSDRDGAMLVASSSLDIRDNRI